MSRPKADFDVAIIGAGPAGATAAIELARAARTVVVFEKKRFPRDKICGGCLSGPAVTCLQELLGNERRLPGPLVGLPGIPCRRISFVIGTSRLECNPSGATRITLRSELDACLTDIAQQEGAEVRYGQTAQLEFSDASWCVRVGSECIRADIILLAAGLGRQINKLGISAQRTGRRLIAQQWLQPTNIALPKLGEVELHWLRGGYVGLATPNQDQCVVALASEAVGRDGESAFERLRRLNPDAAIWSALPPDAPYRFHAMGTAGFPWLPNRLGIGNVLLIGDLAGYAEPYSGDGIAQAMSSARSAARAIMLGSDILAYYTSLIRRRHRRLVQRSRMLSRLLRTSMVHGLATRCRVLPENLLSRIVEYVHVKGTV